MKRNENLVNWQSISATDLERLIRFQLKALWSVDSRILGGNNEYRKIAELIPPMMIWGPPGVGKSSIVRSIAHDLGINFIDVRLAQREPIDIRGLPVPHDDGVHWVISAEWPRDPDSKGIILFDELTSADRTLQVAAYEFILDRRLGDLYTVPDGWYIMAAGNRAEDRAVATTMSSALANRFMHVELEADVNSWVKWAMRNNIHPDVVGFIRFKPESFFDMEGNLEKGWPTPRSWERVSTMLHLTENLQDMDDYLLNLTIDGLVGTGAGIEFVSFRKWNIEMENVLKLMLDPQKKINIPNKADVKYAICSNMVYHLWRAENEEEQQKLIDGFFRISLHLSSDFAAMAMVDAMFGRNPEDVEKYSTLLLKNKQYEKWKERHGEALKKTLKQYGSSNS